MPVQFASFVDSTTVLNATAINALVLAQSCLIVGGIPTTNGTLVLTQPATEAVVNTGAAATYVHPASQALNIPASLDTYVAIANTGFYALTSVASGSAAPQVAQNSLILYKAVASASAVTSITPLVPQSGTATSNPTPVSPTAVSAPDESSANIATYGTVVPAPTDTLQQTVWRIWSALTTSITTLLQSIVSYDAGEVASAIGSGSLLDNLAHIRQLIATLSGRSFAQTVLASKPVLFSDGSNVASTFNVAGSQWLLAAMGINGGPAIKGVLFATATYGGGTITWQVVDGSTHNVEAQYGAGEAYLSVTVTGAKIGDNVQVAYVNSDILSHAVSGGAGPMVDFVDPNWVQVTAQVESANTILVHFVYGAIPTYPETVTAYTPINNPLSSIDPGGTVYLTVLQH